MRFTNRALAEGYYNTVRPHSPSYRLPRARRALAASTWPAYAALPSAQELAIPTGL